MIGTTTAITRIGLTEIMLTLKHCLRRNDLAFTSKKAAFSNMRGTVHQELHQIQDSWLRKKAIEIQVFADHNDMNFYSIHQGHPLISVLMGIH